MVTVKIAMMYAAPASYAELDSNLVAPHGSLDRGPNNENPSPQTGISSCAWNRLQSYNLHLMYVERT
jgi:hypothetical protein